jgi:hypothetical protein
VFAVLAELGGVILVRRTALAISGAVGAVLCCGAFAVAAANAAERTLIRSDVPSLKQKRVGDAAARQALGSPLRGSLRRAVARAGTEASAFSGGGLSVLAGSVQLRSQAQSRKLLSRWSRMRPRPRKVAIGDGGLIAPRGRGNLVVLVRAGKSVGLVQLRARQVTASRRELMLGLARKLAGRLESANAATPIDDLLDRVRPDGSVSKATALAAFERLYGDIPGIKAGPATGDAPVDGNLAIGWVLDHLDALSPAQRNAIGQALGAGIVPAHSRSSALPAAPRRKPFSPDAELLEIAKQRADVYRPLLGQALRLELVVGFVPRFSGVATADALPMDINGDLDINNDSSDTPTRCRIRFSRVRWNASGDQERLHALAHEVFHCFEYQLNPANWGRTSDVAIEGLAEWAAATTVRPYAEPWRRKRVRQYFPQPELSLIERPYASVFFWGRIEEHSGRPLWDRMPALIATQGFADLMLAAGAASDKFSEIWPSSFKLDPSMGPAWTTSHPSQTSQADGPAEPSVVTDTAPIKAPRYTNRLYTLAPDDDDKVLARVELKKGRARVGATDDILAGDRIIGAGETVWLCLDEASSCAVCPNGDATEAPTHTDIGKKPIVAVAGGENGAVGTIEFRDPHEKCGFDVGDDLDPTDPAYCPRRKHERLPNSRAGALRWHLAATKENQRLLEELLPLRRQLDATGEQIPKSYSPGTPEADRAHQLRNDAWRVELEMWPAWCRHQDMGVDSALIVGSLAKRRTLPGPKHPLVRAVKRFGAQSLKMSLRLIHGYSGMPGHNPLASGRPFPEFP